MCIVHLNFPSRLQPGQTQWATSTPSPEARNGASVGRGRGYLRQHQHQVSNFPGSTEQPTSPQQQQPTSPVSPPVSTPSTRGVRPIVGRAQETGSAASLFNFRTMAATLESQKQNHPTQPAPVDFTTNQQQHQPPPSGDEWTAPSEAPSGYNIDTQVSRLGMVLAQATIPAGKDAERKLEALRQDPNHPLYSVTSFESMDLKEDLKRGLNADRKYKLSAIQEKTLPALNSPP